MNNNIYGIQKMPETEVRNGETIAKNTGIAAGTTFADEMGKHGNPKIAAGMAVISGGTAFAQDKFAQNKERRANNKENAYNQYTDDLADVDIAQNRQVAGIGEKGFNRYDGMANIEGGELVTDKNHNTVYDAKGDPSHENRGKNIELDGHNVIPKDKRTAWLNAVKEFKMGSGKQVTRAKAKLDSIVSNLPKKAEKFQHPDGSVTKADGVPMAGKGLKGVPMYEDGVQGDGMAYDKGGNPIMSKDGVHMTKEEVEYYPNNVDNSQSNQPTVEEKKAADGQAARLASDKMASFVLDNQKIKADASDLFKSDSAKVADDKLYGFDDQTKGPLGTGSTISNEQSFYDKGLGSMLGTTGTGSYNEGYGDLNTANKYIEGKDNSPVVKDNASEVVKKTTKADPIIKAKVKSKYGTPEGIKRPNKEVDEVINNTKRKGSPTMDFIDSLGGSYSQGEIGGQSPYRRDAQSMNPNSYDDPTSAMPGMVARDNTSFKKSPDPTMPDSGISSGLDDAPAKDGSNLKGLAGNALGYMGTSASAINNLITGYGEDDKVARNYYTPEKQKYQKLSGTAKKENLENRNAALLASRGKGQTAGTMEGMNRAISGQYTKANERINEKENFRFYQNEAQNTQAENQAQMANLQLTNKYNEQDAQNKAAGKRYVDQGWSEVSTMAQLGVQENNLKRRNDAQDKMDAETVRMLGTGDMYYDDQKVLRYRGGSKVDTKRGRGAARYTA